MNEEGEAEEGGVGGGKRGDEEEHGEETFYYFKPEPFPYGIYNAIKRYIWVYLAECFLNLLLYYILAGNTGPRGFLAGSDGLRSALWGDSGSPDTEGPFFRCSHTHQIYEKPIWNPPIHGSSNPPGVPKLRISTNIVDYQFKISFLIQMETYLKRKIS